MLEMNSTLDTKSDKKEDVSLEQTDNQIFE